MIELQLIEDKDNQNKIKYFKEIYQYKEFLFSGNEEYDSCYVQIEDFCFDDYGSLMVTVREDGEECFDIYWKEVENEEFD